LPGRRLSIGIGAVTLFGGVTLGYMFFLEEPAFQGHGALGITTGSLVLLFGTIPVFVIGVVIAVVIAAKRARTAK
jgi:hypothetical protein